MFFQPSLRGGQLNSQRLVNADWKPATMYEASVAVRGCVQRLYCSFMLEVSS